MASSPSSWGERHTLVSICCLMAALNYALRFNLSIGIVAMVRDPATKISSQSYPTISTIQKSTEVCPALRSSQNLTVPNTNNTTQFISQLTEDSFSPKEVRRPEKEITPPTYDWDEKDQGLILGAFYWGYIISQFPSGLLAKKYGGKWIIAWAMLATGILSIAIPQAANYGGRDYVIGVRVLIGFAEGFVIPALVTMKAQWFPPEERARLSAFCFAGFPLGTAVMMLVSGQVIPVLGWPAVFYIPGVLAIFVFLVWIMKVHSSPEDHPDITPDELKYITSSIYNGGIQKSDNEPVPDPVPAHDDPEAITPSSIDITPTPEEEVGIWDVPWKDIACSLPVWATFTSQFCNAWSHNMLKSEGPKYLHSALNFDIRKNSYIAASPYLLQMTFAIIFARLSDYLLERKLISMLTARKLCNSIGQWGVVLAFVGVIASGCNQIPAVICYISYGILGGAMLGGAYVNVIDISPRYAGIIEAVINSFANVAGFGAPYVAGLILYNEPSILGWRYVFMVPVIANLIGNMFFLIGADTKVQPWNDKGRTK